MPGGFPAARLTDMHTCPICMGAPLPIVGIGAPTVLIGKLPAARQTDLCVCIPPIVPDMIAFGSPTVLIFGMPAARMADPTAKGGVILPPCCPTVLIGLVGIPVITMPGGLGPIWVETLPDGSTVTHIGDNITIAGTPEFQKAVINDMNTLYGTPTGRSLIDSINNSPGGKVTIVETANGNSVTGFGAGSWLKPDGTPGSGSNSTLNYNPNRTEIGDGTEAWTNRPPAVALGHEMVHVTQVQGGRLDPAQNGGTPNYENEAVGLPPFENAPHTENKIRSELGEAPRPYY